MCLSQFLLRMNPQNVVKHLQFELFVSNSVLQVAIALKRSLCLSKPQFEVLVVQNKNQIFHSSALILHLGASANHRLITLLYLGVTRQTVLGRLIVYQIVG